MSRPVSRTPWIPTPPSECDRERTGSPPLTAAGLVLCLLALVAPVSLDGQVRDEGGEGGPPVVPVRLDPPATERVTPDPEPDERAALDERLAALGLVPGRPVVRPTRTESPPTVDGRLDDPVWAGAARLERFVQQSPRDGAPATEETTVWIAYDSEHLYLGFHARYLDPSIMRASRVDRDRAFRDDLITVYLDTFLDQQRAYDFDVNAYGVQGDGIVDAGSGGGGGIPRADRSWDALFETAGRIVEDGFTAEMAIPFKSLRYPEPGEGEPHRWGLQIVREIKGKDGENDVWAPMSRDRSSFTAQMGLMEGMTGLSTSRNLEILPTFTAVRHGSIDETVPGFVDRGTDPDAGVNVKYGVTSNLTADFTLNPDFSQIESDRPQIDVNQRFPLFFPELRPFFVEGGEIFDIAGPVTFVHTRSIVDPDYGVKLTGKVGPTTLGILTANDRAPGKVDDPDDPAFGHTAKTFIGRVKYDLYSQSHVGAVLTDREFLDGHSRLAGVDGDLRLGATSSMSFRAVGTRNREPGGPERDGHVLDVSVRRDGRHLDWFLAGYQISPEFGTDAGFVRRTDQRRLVGRVSYRFWPQSWIINWGPSVRYGRNWRFDEVLQDENLRIGLRFSFARNVRVDADLDRDLERFGGIDFEKTRFSVDGRVNASRTVSLGGSFGLGDQIFYGDTPFLGHGTEWGLNATLRPLPRLTSRVRVEASRLTDPDDGRKVFDVKVLRALSTFQVTDRVSARNIAEYNSFDETLGLNLLLTYRVNAGTVFFLGYDDRYRQADLIEGDRDGDGVDERLFFEEGLRRTDRAIFVKMQYLFRL